jgi:hypothetical protein
MSQWRIIEGSLKKVLKTQMLNLQPTAKPTTSNTTPTTPKPNDPNQKLFRLVKTEIASFSSTTLSIARSNRFSC